MRKIYWADGFPILLKGLVQFFRSRKSLLKKDLCETVRELMSNCGSLADSFGHFYGAPFSRPKLLESVCHTRLRYHHLPLREDLAFLRNPQDISLRVSRNLVFWKEPIFGNLIECRFLLFGGDIRPGRSHSLRFAKLFVEVMQRFAKAW